MKYPDTLRLHIVAKFYVENSLLFIIGPSRVSKGGDCQLPAYGAHDGCPCLSRLRSFDGAYSDSLVRFGENLVYFGIHYQSP